MAEYYEDITDEFDKLVTNATLLEFDARSLSGQWVKKAQEVSEFALQPEDMPWVHALRWGGTAAVMVIALVVSLLSLAR